MTSQREWRAAGCRGGQLAGEGGVERAEQRAVPGAVRPVLEGGQRDRHLGQPHARRGSGCRLARIAAVVAGFGNVIIVAVAVILIAAGITAAQSLVPGIAAAASGITSGAAAIAAG